MALSIITDKFRIENAKKFVQSIKDRPYPSDFSTTTTDYEREYSSNLNSNTDVLYMSIGKITSWYDNQVEVPVPDVNKTLRQESEIWSNSLAMKKINPTNIKHIIPRENWSSTLLVYPYYKSDDSNISTFSSPAEQNFYVLDEEEHRVYKCLFNNYGGPSVTRPTHIGGVGGDPRRYGSEPFETEDGYIWKYMYTITPAEAINFLTDSYMPVHKDENVETGIGNATVDGAIYRIILSDKSVASDSISSPSGGTFARAQILGINTALDNDSATGELTIDLTAGTPNNRTRMAVNDNNDLVGYQIEHIIEDVEGNRTVEIGEILSSTFDDIESEVTVTITRRDNKAATGFTEPTSSTETWFISPLVDIRGEGKNASAMMYLLNEPGYSAGGIFYPEELFYENKVYDIIMNTVGQDYKNTHRRDEFSSTPESLVFIKQGIAAIGENVGDSVTPLEDREISNFTEIVSVTPKGGHSYDNISELYGYTIMINQTFSGHESGSATISNDFRQLALIQNPVKNTDPEVLANDDIYRQTIRLDFQGDITGIIDYDDEISDVDTMGGEKTVSGHIVEWEYDETRLNTLVYLSSTVGFIDSTADEIYNLNDGHHLYVTYDYSANQPIASPIELTLTTDFIDEESDGYYQKGLASGTVENGLKFMTGDVMYIENRQPVVRAEDQSENVKLVIQY